MKFILLCLAFIFSGLSNAAIVNVSVDGSNVWDSDYSSVHPFSLSFSYDTSNLLKGGGSSSYEIRYKLLNFDIDVGKDLAIDGFDTKDSYISIYTTGGYLDLTMLVVYFTSSFGNFNFTSFTSFYYYPWMLPWLSNFDDYILSAEELTKVLKTNWQSDTMWAYHAGPYFSNILEASYNIFLDTSTLVVSYQNNVVSEPGSLGLIALGIILIFALRRSSRRDLGLVSNV